MKMENCPPYVIKSNIEKQSRIASTRSDIYNCVRTLLCYIYLYVSRIISIIIIDNQKYLNVDNDDDIMQ